MQKDIMDLNILIIDNDEDILDISKELLSNFVKKIFVAKKREDIDRYVQNFLIDVVIVSNNLKNYTGCDIVEFVKDYQKDIYPILITNFGRDFVEAKDNIARLGITRFLTKPYKLDILLNMLGEINTLKKTNNYYQSLQEVNSTLENEILRNSKLLEDKNYVISSQSRYVVLGEMFSMIMHQIMQPLQAIKMTASIMGFRAKRDAIESSYVDKESAQIIKSCDFLADTVLSFKNFHSINKNRDYIYPKDVINESIKLIETNLKQNNIEIEVNNNNNKQILTCKNELIQVVLNLINNAKDALVINKIKNPKIVIDIEGLDRHKIVVSDNGGGIPKKVVPNIFKSHFSTKLKEGGSGLGLYMSKMIVENSLMGTINYKEIKNGSSFEVEI
jgi:signal transduction histidine kinase